MNNDLSFFFLALISVVVKDLLMGECCQSYLFLFVERGLPERERREGEVIVKTILFINFTFLPSFERVLRL